MPRPRKCRMICSHPRVSGLIPVGLDAEDTVQLGFDEYETIRLIDGEHYSQSDCAAKMNVARTTVTRMYASARQKLADVLVNGKRLVIGGGDIAVCPYPKPECRNVPNCCHRNGEGSFGEAEKDKQV